MTIFRSNENFIFSNNFDQKCYYFREIFNEASIEVDKIDKSLNVSNANRRLSIDDDLNFTRVYANVIDIDDEISIRDFDFVKLEFVDVYLYVCFLESF